MDCRQRTGVGPTSRSSSSQEARGGGRVKIVNQSVPGRWKKLGYKPRRGPGHRDYVRGTATLKSIAEFAPRSSSRAPHRARDRKVEKSLERCSTCGPRSRRTCSAQPAFRAWPPRHRQGRGRAEEAGLHGEQIDAASLSCAAARRSRAPPSSRPEHIRGLRLREPVRTLRGLPSSAPWPIGSMYRVQGPHPRSRSRDAVSAQSEGRGRPRPFWRRTR